MALFIFKGANSTEIIKLKVITREKIHIATSLTGYKFADVSKKFYDTEEEKEKVKRLSENAFKIYVIMNFAKQNYKFVQYQND